MIEPLEMRLIERGRGPTVFVSGDLDRASIAGLRRCLLSLAGQHVTLDLAGVTFMDSSAIALLVEAHRRSERVGGSLRLRYVRAAEMRLFEITGVEAVLDLDGDR